MIRTTAMTVSFLMLTGSPFAATQAHPEQHAQTRSHDASGHPAMDPTQHAALHALLHGDWRGTMSSEDGASTAIALNVSRGSAGRVLFGMTGDASRHIGSATEISVVDRTVRWIQELSGTPCKATADLVAATEHAPETLKGRMSCARESFTLTLTKTTQ